MEEVIQDELYKYGFLPLLIVLERMEEVEDYEVCKAIINVLKKTNTRLDIDLPTKLDGEAIAQMKITFMTKFNLSGNIAYNNSEWYADEIVKEIEKQKGRLQV